MHKSFTAVGINETTGDNVSLELLALSITHAFDVAHSLDPEVHFNMVIPGHCAQALAFPQPGLKRIVHRALPGEAELAAQPPEVVSTKQAFDGLPSSNETIRTILMSDLVGQYTDPIDVPDWSWVQSNASFEHRLNAQAGVWEFILNLSNWELWSDIPPALLPVLEDAKNEGVGYLLFHQGT